jgi:hypothetical protein
MLVAVFGTSTAYAYWGFSIVGHVMDAIHGEHCRIHCLDLMGLRDKWEGRDGRPVLVTSDRPDPDLSRLLTSSGFPCLAFVDEPGDAVANAVRANGMALHEAIRFSTNYFSCLGVAVPVAGVRVFGTHIYQATVHDLVGEILVEILGEVDEEIRARAVQRIAAEVELGPDLTVRDAMTRITDGALLPGRARNLLPVEDQDLIDAVAAAYSPIFEQREFVTFEWPRELFFTASDADSNPAEIKLLGGARHLVWGPYLYLPPRGWRAKIAFEVVENNSGNEIEADVCVDSRVVVSGRTVLPVEGHFEICLDFRVPNPNMQIEIRVRLLKGAIEGRFRLRKVELEAIALGPRIAPSSPQLDRPGPLAALAAPVT